MSRHRKPISVYLIPIAFLAVLVSVLLLAFRDRLIPATAVDVTVAMAIATAVDRSEASPPSTNSEPAAMLFQATGWIEPDPLPIRATTLYSGVVKEVHALEGESVRQGQLLATLVDDDARLALRNAEAALGEQHAAFRHVEAQIKVAQARLITLTMRQKSENLRLEETTDEFQRLQALPARAVPERDVVRANLRKQSQAALASAAAGEVGETEAVINQVQRQLELRQQLINAAEVDRDRAQLHLDRTRITAPTDGMILRLLAAPGLRRMLEMDQPDSATIAILYQPDHLQARVDVPLADAGKITVGQPTRIHCSLLPESVFTGAVTRIVGEADWQRNTLQVKVRLIDPDPRLRPEMLCRAEFFAPPAQPEGSAGSNGDRNRTQQRLTVLVPESVLLNREGNRASIWVVSIDGTHAEQRQVRLGNKRLAGHITVLEGVRPGDRVIVNAPESLKPGARIAPRAAPEPPALN